MLCPDETSMILEISGKNGNYDLWSQWPKGHPRSFGKDSLQDFSSFHPDRKWVPAHLESKPVIECCNDPTKVWEWKLISGNLREAPYIARKVPQSRESPAEYNAQWNSLFRELANPAGSASALYDNMMGALQRSWIQSLWRGFFFYSFSFASSRYCLLGYPIVPIMYF